MLTRVESSSDTESELFFVDRIAFRTEEFRRMSSAIFDDQGNRVVDPSVTWPPHTSPMSQSQSASGSQSVSGTTSANRSPSPLDQFQPSSSSSSASSVPVPVPTYGAPFRVQWIRTIPIPFNQIKHLKNPWNGDVGSIIRPRALVDA